jgi:hypothetical protein
MARWERSQFATSAEELEISEAIRAVERVLESPTIKGSTRVSLSMAREARRPAQP